MARSDAAAVRAALADPRAVARALGLERGARREGARGLVVLCPAHGDRSPSLSLQVRGGTLSARCWQCGWGGDLLALVAEVEGLDVRRDFGRVLARAAELAGGSVRATVQEIVNVKRPTSRLPEEIAAELFARVCEAGALGRRGAVESYLERRGLLDAARADGWASLPSLATLLDVARGVWQEGRGLCAEGRGRASKDVRRSEAPGCPGAFVFCESRRTLATAPESIRDGGPAREPLTISSPEELLVAARLARWGRDGELRLLWGRHRLVIPWRGRDGRIQALQRRLVDAPRRMSDGREEPRYVLTWAPREPYGVDWLDPPSEERMEGGGTQGDHETYGSVASVKTNKPISRDFAWRSVVPVIFVEGAMDVLAMRCLRPGRAAALGLPGTGAWETRWASLAAGRVAYFGFDADAAGDERAAKAAIDVAEAQGLKPEAARLARRRLDERLGAQAQIKRDEEHKRITADVAAERRTALGTARCVLCGVEAPLLCRGCGRVRPGAKDWGKVWEERIRRRG